jgi:hypothetical protein
MKTISIKNDIVPIAEFKTSLSKWFKSLQGSGHPAIITQNGKPVRELLFKKYRIVSRVKKNTVEILTVFEGHRLLHIDEIGL